VRALDADPQRAPQRLIATALPQTQACRPRARGVQDERIALYLLVEARIGPKAHTRQRRCRRGNA
jgi:hypothetical protein